MKRAGSATLFWLVVGLGLAAAGTVGAWVRYRQPNLLLAWKPFVLTQHQFDYELEFVKRGLVGEVLRQVGAPRTIVSISVFSWIVLAGLAALLVCFDRRCAAPAAADGSISPRSIWLWAVFLSPATFLQAGGDLGRLDPMLIGCEIGLLLQALGPGRWRLPAAAVLTAVGIATHELFLLAQLPLVLAVHAYLAWHQPERRRELGLRAATIATVALAGAALIARWGKMDGLTANEYLAFLQQHRGLVNPSQEGVAVVYNSLRANIGYAWQQLASKAPWGIPIAAAAMLAYLGCALAAVRRERTNALLLVVGAVAPLLLLLLAYDYGRWFAFSTVNILLALSICQLHPAAAIDWKPLRWTCVFVVLGPYGVTIGFPWWL